MTSLVLIESTKFVGFLIAIFAFVQFSEKHIEHAGNQFVLTDKLYFESNLSSRLNRNKLNLCPLYPKDLCKN